MVVVVAGVVGDLLLLAAGATGGIAQVVTGALHGALHRRTLILVEGGEKLLGLRRGRGAKGVDDDEQVALDEGGAGATEGRGGGLGLRAGTFDEAHPEGASGAGAGGLHEALDDGGGEAAGLAGDGAAGCEEVTGDGVHGGDAGPQLRSGLRRRARVAAEAGARGRDPLHVDVDDLQEAFGPLEGGGVLLLGGDVEGEATDAALDLHRRRRRAADERHQQALRVVEAAILEGERRRQQRRLAPPAGAGLEAGGGRPGAGDVAGGELGLGEPVEGLRATGLVDAGQRRRQPGEHRERVLREAGLHLGAGLHEAGGRRGAVIDDEGDGAIMKPEVGEAIGEGRPQPPRRRHRLEAPLGLVEEALPAIVRRRPREGEPGRQVVGLAGHRGEHLDEVTGLADAAAGAQHDAAGGLADGRGGVDGAGVEAEAVGVGEALDVALDGGVPHHRDGDEGEGEAAGLVVGGALPGLQQQRDGLPLAAGLEAHEALLGLLDQLGRRDAGRRDDVLADLEGDPLTPGRRGHHGLGRSRRRRRLRRRRRGRGRRGLAPDHGETGGGDDSADNEAGDSTHGSDMAHPVDNRKPCGDVPPMPETSAAAPTSRLHLHQSKKVGMLPGSLVHIGQAPPMASRISIIEYDADHHSSRDVEDLGKEPTGCRRHTDSGSVVWVNVDGNSNAETIAALGDRFGLHPLVLEDLMNAGERTKLEEHDDCLFVVLKMLAVDEKDDIVVVEQISLILGRGFVISVQERAGDVFDAVRERLRLNKGRIRRMGADYLFYALIDAIVDHYAVALEAMAGLVEEMDEVLQETPARVDVTDLYLLKREVLFLRRQIAPARDIFAELNREGSEQSLISGAVDVYFRDVLDHCTRATEHADLLREMTMSMVDMYHSLQSARLNEVMRILTVISTIFIPLTFIAGVYGMNFDVMPELRHPLGYYICLGVMAAIGLGMIIYVKRNRWL